jgi:hypothetical protein
MRRMQGSASGGVAEDAGGAHVLCGAVLAVGGPRGQRGVRATHDQHLGPLMATSANRAALCEERDVQKPPRPGAALHRL